MIGKPNITEHIISFLGGVDRFLNAPSNAYQAIVSPSRSDARIGEKARAEERRERKRIQQALWRLEKASVVTFDKKLNEFRLTPTGWLKFVHYYNKHQSKHVEKGNKGDYVIIFDIPEEHRRFRDLFRQCLMNLDCKIIQRSVFHTDDANVFSFAQRIVSNCDLDDCVKFIEAKRIY